MENRFEGLQRFLSAVCEHPLLRHSPALLAFLKYSDEEQYQEFKKELEDTVPAFANLKDNFSLEAVENLDLKHLKSLTGHFRSRLDKSLHTFAVEAENTLAKSATSYIALKNLSLQLMTDLEKVSQTIGAMTTELSSLATLNATFNESVEEGHWTQLGTVYKDMQKMMEDWGRQTNMSAVLVKEHLFKTFRYSLSECEPALEIIRMRNSASHGYFNAVKTLNDTKESLLEDRDPSTWNLDSIVTASKILPEVLRQNPDLAKHYMLSDKKKPLHKLKLLFGYLNDQMVSELSWLADEKAVRYARNFGNWGNERAEVLAEESRSLTEFLDKLRTLLEQSQKLTTIVQPDTPSSS